MTGERIAGTWYATKNDSTGVASESESVSLDAGTYCLKIQKDSYSCFYSFSINSPHQHSYNYAYTVKSTYTSQGYDVYTCSCGASYTTNYKAVKKLGKVNLKSVSSARKNIQSKHLGIKNQVQTVTKFIIQEIRISKKFQLKRL